MKNLIPLAIIIAGVVVAGAFVYINQDSLPGIDADKAGEKTISYINENILVGVSPASLVDVSDSGSVYKIRLKIEEMEFDSYVSKDGRFLFPEGYDMDEVLVQDPITESPQAPAQPEASLLPQEELREFVACLENKGVEIYGEDWCPYCQQIVALFGGKETIEPIYVDCAEEKELCYTEKGITGVPALFINNEEYLGARSIEALAQETGCNPY